jgi:8-oxo-dGTP pyrophosphatase MutT (NUDIX family)
MPGAMVVAQRDDGRILMTRRADNAHWCLPAGAAEVGGSFASTALAELAEEVGLEVAIDDLIPFGTLSSADNHTIHYPNGDLTHCFAVLFLVRRWEGAPAPDGEEAVDVCWVDLAEVPQPCDPPASKALDSYRAFLSTGRFQLA